MFAPMLRASWKLITLVCTLFCAFIKKKKRETSVLQYVRRVNGLHVSYCVSGCWLVDVCDYHSEVFAASAGWVLQSALYN